MAAGWRRGVRVVVVAGIIAPCIVAAGAVSLADDDAGVVDADAGVDVDAPGVTVSSPPPSSAPDPVPTTDPSFAFDRPARASGRAVRSAPIRLTDPPAPPQIIDDRVVHLTFDDGPTGYTPAVLDLLARHDARATFFVLGSQVRGNAGLVRRMVSDGHAVANHTWSHPPLAGISAPRFWQQIGWSQALLAEVTGRVPTCLRPPYGSMDANTVGWSAQFGLRVVMWDIDPQDWRMPGAGSIASHVVSRAWPGAVVLLHDGGGSRHQTVSALASILGELSARGYRFEPVPGC